MKITKRQLKRIIKEEKAKVLAENRILLESPAAMEELMYALRMEGGSARHAYELGNEMLFNILMQHGITEWRDQVEMVEAAAAQVNTDDSILDSVLDGLRDA